MNCRKKKWKNQNKTKYQRSKLTEKSGISLPMNPSIYMNNNELKINEKKKSIEARAAAVQLIIKHVAATSRLKIASISLFHPRNVSSLIVVIIALER